MTLPATLLACIACLWAVVPRTAAEVQVVYVTDSPQVLEPGDPAQAFVLGFGDGADDQAPPPQPHRSMIMRSVNGTSYRCYIPDTSGSEEEAGSSVRTEAQGSLRGQRTPTELLEALSEHCHYRIEEWWSYELCYGKRLRQYHKENGKLVSQYVLGRYAQEQPAADTVQVDPDHVSGALRYVAHSYPDGEACELTGKPRQAEVRFTCGAGDDTLFASIKELASCQYLATISTPHLCKHPAFQQQPTPATLIQCHPLPSAAAAAPLTGGQCGDDAQQQGQGTCSADAAGGSMQGGAGAAAAGDLDAASAAASDNASLAAGDEHGGEDQQADGDDPHL